MSRDPSAESDRSLPALRWAARALALAVLSLYAAIFIGEGGVVPWRIRPEEAVQMAFFSTTCLGLVVAWRREAVGGLIALAGLSSFYLNELRLTGGFPRGWALAAPAVPAVLFLASAAMDRRRRAAPAAVLARRSRP